MEQQAARGKPYYHDASPHPQGRRYYQGSKSPFPCVRRLSCGCYAHFVHAASTSCVTRAFAITKVLQSWSIRKFDAGTITRFSNLQWPQLSIVAMSYYEWYSNSPFNPRYKVSYGGRRAAANHPNRQFYKRQTLQILQL